jgi:hypothetical protein
VREAVDQQRGGEVLEPRPARRTRVAEKVRAEVAAPEDRQTARGPASPSPRLSATASDTRQVLPAGNPPSPSPSLRRQTTAPGRAAGSSGIR